MQNDGNSSEFYPYHTLRVSFPRTLSSEEMNTIEQGFRVVSMKTQLPLQHLHEVLRRLPVSGPHASFFWNETHETLYYTAAELRGGQEYEIHLPQPWYVPESFRRFRTARLTGSLRIFHLRIPSQRNWEERATRDGVSLQDEAARTYQPVELGIEDGTTYQRAEIKVRGGSTAMGPKKSYTVRFDSRESFTDFPEGHSLSPSHRLVLNGNGLAPAYFNNRYSLEMIREVEASSSGYGFPLGPRVFTVLMTLNGRLWGLYDAIEHVSSGAGGWSVS
ncbi:MAG: CotH kinase family protein, partial [Bdellovibrionales bacterium]|nr:CotH kinase family protein [Bdellovibrionales bacterium]